METLCEYEQATSSCLCWKAEAVEKQNKLYRNNYWVRYFLIQHSTSILYGSISLIRNSSQVSEASVICQSVCDFDSGNRQIDHWEWSIQSLV